MFVQRKRRKGIRFNFCLKTPELMIFERKEKLPLARNERNETRASCRREKSAAREREKIATQNTRGKKISLGFRGKREKREKMYKSSTVKKRLETR